MHAYYCGKCHCWTACSLGLAGLVIVATTVVAQGWHEVQRISPIASNPVNDYYFGYDVAVSGSNAVVGAWGDNYFVNGYGAAFVFRRTGSGGWNQIAELMPIDAKRGQNFGTTVGISGTKLIVGATADSETCECSGAAYVFSESNTGSWSQIAKLSSASADDSFGWSVAVDGNTAIVGASASDDGAIDSGSAYVFRDDGSGNWAQVAKLTPNDPVRRGYFGFDVALAGDTAIIGATRLESFFATPTPGKAYIFREDASGNWNQVAEFVADNSLRGGFGSSVSISEHTAVAGSSLDGAIHVFQNAGSGVWAQVAKLDADSDEGFYRDIAIDEGIIAAPTLTRIGGIPNVYFFTDQGSGNWSRVAKLTIPGDPNDFFDFGRAVSISGGTAIFGAMSGQDGGTAVLFHVPEPNAILLASIAVIGSTLLPLQRHRRVD